LIALVRIVSLFNTKEKRILLNNFLSLSLLQVANYIFPLITLPYLVRVLGPERFGLISFSQAFIGYFQILTDYGFTLSATREISIYREDKEKVSEIFSSVMIIKSFLFLISLIMVSIIVFSFEKFKQDWLIYHLTLGMVLGQVLFPVWVFQGMERMKYITFLNISSRLIFTVAIFVFVKKVEDYLYVSLLNSLGSIIVGLLALWIVFKDFGIEFRMPSLESIKYHLKEGWYIFISTVAISLYTTSNTFILGLFTNNTIVGYYSAAERIIKAVLGLLSPISQTLYPHISKLIKESEETGIKFIRKVTSLIGGLSFVLSLSVFIFADLIVKIILGSHYAESVVVLRILAFLPFIVGLSNVFGIQTMLTLSYKKEFSKILIFASIINVTLAFIMVPVFKHIGISISVLLSEIFITVSMFLFLQNKGIKVLGGKFV